MAPTLYLSRTSPPCRTVVFVAKQLGIELNEVVVDMKNGEHRKPEFLKLNPRHSVPTLEDNGVGIWESRAIAQYLCNKYAPDSALYPKDPAQRAKVDVVLNFDLSSWGPALRNSLVSRRIFFEKRQNILCFETKTDTKFPEQTAKAFRGVDPTEEQLKTLQDTLQVLDTLIARNGGYVAANHLTIADLSLLANSGSILYLDYDLKPYPNIEGWYKRLAKELSFFDEFKATVIETYKKRAQEMAKNQ
ncbi:unnamed protein product [Oppiella nova]|uniref:Glutathione S-transferase n=1 Tax=Oppiella nova TaxID=334625 RepID=A0A7R9QHV1_9ACAR|nr:unnamed protein product [Oppiella nova]CAG2166063.1 unnamed protein product [Oppiella nova]